MFSHLTQAYSIGIDVSDWNKTSKDLLIVLRGYPLLRIGSGIGQRGVAVFCGDGGLWI